MNKVSCRKSTNEIGLIEDEPPQQYQTYALVLNNKTISDSDSFRKSFYPHITKSEWNNWRWQVQNSIKTLKQLENFISLSDDERETILKQGNNLPICTTPYYLSLIDPIDTGHPLRRTVVPVSNELVKSFGEEDDPLCENKHSPTPCIVHRYHNRVLFLVTNICASYCRYCTRSRLVGRTETVNNLSRWKEAIEYIQKNTQIKDVLISGGDPLLLSDENIEWLLSRLYRIPHIEFLRIGTKAPIVLPQRITTNLINILKRYQPLWMSIHVIHPLEITTEVKKACNRLADSGIPLGSQTVLLSGINDDVDLMRQLMHKLLTIRVRPYYLYQCDPITGSAHFRTPVEKGLEIIKGLRGHITGYGVPTYVIDCPGGGGKISLYPQSIIARDDNYILLKNYEDKEYCYPDKGSFN